ncbi:MAG TPA: hypothetical protein VGL56_08375 [Fimbriimonadaceae bacterium]|jgi:hypothetical protein
MMKRVHQSDYRPDQPAPVEGAPIEQEVVYLRDENRRLKGLLELSEDRSALDKFQVQSRNKLIILFGLLLVCIGLSTFYVMGTRATINEQKIEITKLKRGVIFNDSSTP